jgi:competence protein ComEA
MLRTATGGDGSGGSAGDAEGDAAGGREAGLDGEAEGDAAVPADRTPAGWVPDRRAPGAGRGRAWAARLTTAGPWGELAEKWVPEQLRGARVDPKRRGAVLLSAVAAIAAVAAALGVWWSRPQPVPVGSAADTALAVSTAQSLGGGPGDDTSDQGIDGAQQVADGAEDVPDGADDAADAEQVATGPAAPADSTSPGNDPSGPIVVSVTGDVRHPGVVTVPAGARVADAIAAAGGAVDQSDLTGLNLAARLTDGSSVVVTGDGGSTVAVGSSGNAVDGAAAGSLGAADSSRAAAATKVDLNTADATALQTLSGVGPVTAEAIIAYRTEHGPFTDLAQLQEVSGIGPATFARLEPHVTL